MIYRCRAQQLRGVLDAVQANPGLNTAAPPIADVLGNCLRDLQEFHATVQRLDSKLGEVTTSKGWKAVGGIIKEADIQIMCGKVERHKLALSLAIGNESV